jgi:hypothetical protein
MSSSSSDESKGRGSDSDSDDGNDIKQLVSATKATLDKYYGNYISADTDRRNRYKGKKGVNAN